MSEMRNDNSLELSSVRGLRSARRLPALGWAAAHWRRGERGGGGMGDRLTLLCVALAIVLCSSLLHGQTTVTGTIQAPTGDAVSGSCSIQALGFTSAAGASVFGAPVIVKFTAGVFSAVLTPTAGATPSGQYYRAICNIPLQTVAGHSVGPYSDTKPRYWLVPSAPSTVTIRDIEVSSVPSPSLLIQPAQINAAALTNGTYCLQVAGGQVTGLIACTGGGGGGGGPISWATLTSATWSGITSSTWSGVIQ